MRRSSLEQRLSRGTVPGEARHEGHVRVDGGGERMITGFPHRCCGDLEAALG
jgi:hypothetical protein